MIRGLGSSTALGSEMLVDEDTGESSTLFFRLWFRMTVSRVIFVFLSSFFPLLLLPPADGADGAGATPVLMARGIDWAG